ncbi:MAG: hypothetical protein QOG80_473 [Pseudonocardiales bacterium]|nr:hypothetical protein [Pseudonocardiales bacterium]
MTVPRRPSFDELANGPLDAEDARVLDGVGRLFDTLDPVPGALVERIQFGITLDALHAEIAELQRSVDLVGVRADELTETQTITFTSANLTTMVTITPTSADSVRIDGWITPGADVLIELRTVDDVRRTTADQDGRFVLDDLPRGYAQFVIRPPEGSGEPPVVTPSIEL